MKSIFDRPETWIDFVEGELSAGLKKDLASYAQGHPGALGEVKAWTRLRREVKALKVEVPEESAYYDNLHDRIMGSVGKSKQESKVILLIRKHSVRAVAAALVAVFGGQMILNSVRLKQQGSEQVAQTRNLQSPGEFVVDTTGVSPSSLSGSIFSNEDDIDMYMNMAAEQLEKGSEKDREELLKSLKQ